MNYEINERPQGLDSDEKFNDPEYGRCETCRNYGRAIDCDGCDEGSNYQYASDYTS